MNIITAIANYLAVMLGNDPDPLNDWLTHMPHVAASIMLVVGYVIEIVRSFV